MTAPVGLEAAGSREMRVILVDKNLATLGFFTPSSHRIKRERAKTVHFTKTVNSEKVEVSATIVPSALHGLPITADQDKFLALQELLRPQCSQTEIANPVRFSSAALLRALGLSDNGRNHRDVSEWLDLMASTTIISEGAVYLSGSKRWARDRFRVFDRAVSRGQEFGDGTIAESNYIWLSDWQLQNINNRHLLPIDLTIYQELKTHIARALVLHLQVWLYASQRAQVFEKRYGDICQLLGLRPYDHRSKIVEKLGPALDELATSGFLANWQVARTADDRGFKLVLRHGPLFSTDGSHARSIQPAAVVEPQPPASAQRGHHPERQCHDAQTLEALISRGVTAKVSRRLLAAVEGAQDVVRQLEWGDFVISRAAAGTFWNPAGFYVAIVRDNLAPPDYFLSSRQRAERDDAHRAYITEATRRQRLNDEYRHYCEREAAAHIAALDPTERDRLITAEAQDIRSRFPSMRWTPESLRSVGESALRARLVTELPVLGIGEFAQARADETNVARPAYEEAIWLPQRLRGRRRRSALATTSPRGTQGTLSTLSTSTSLASPVSSSGTD